MQRLLAPSLPAPSGVGGVHVLLQMLRDGGHFERSVELLDDLLALQQRHLRGIGMPTG